MSTNVTRDLALGLSKAGLHPHLGGTLELDLKLALAHKNDVDIGQSTVGEVQATYRFNGPTSFLTVYYLTMDVLQDEDDFHDLAAIYFERARANNVMRAEYFFDPQAHTSRDIAIETATRGYRRAVAEAREAGLSADLILYLLCDISAQSALETLQAALSYKDMFIDVGLDSGERDNPPTRFAEVFALVHEAGLHVTMRCDIGRVGSIDSIRAALIELGTERLDHGTDIIEDPELVIYTRDRDISLTPCPLSSSFVTEEMKRREIVGLTVAGVEVSVNSDDPAYLDDYVGDSYLALAQYSGLGHVDLERIARNLIRIARISDDEEIELLERVDHFVSENQPSTSEAGAQGRECMDPPRPRHAWGSVTLSSVQGGHALS